MRVGDRLGKYRLTRRLGDGAMGVVWAAVNEDTQREVALKLLHGADAELRQRLLREAVASGRLDHRNVITIYDVGATPEGDPFLVMQLLTGETLASKLKREGKLPPEVVARIGAAIASGLGAAHGVGIVHRDLKPANVFLHRETGSRDEVVKLLDFGVSRLESTGGEKLTATGDLLGSPAYMSPEQAGGSTRIGPRSDLWSLGVLLFEMLAGRRPFVGPSMMDTLVQVMTEPIPSLAALEPAVPANLVALVHACLQREIEGRPASAAEVADRLLAEASAAPPPLPTRAAPAFAVPTFALSPAPPGGTERMLSAQRVTTPMVTTPMLRAPRLAPPTVATPVPTTPIQPVGVGRVAPGARPLRSAPLLIAVGALVAVGLLVVLTGRDPGGPAAPPPSDAKAAVAPRATDAPATAEPTARESGPTVALILSVDVPAQVFLDGRAMGVTPMAPLNVQPGLHNLRFRHATLGERSLTVEVKRGVSMAVTVELTKKDGFDSDRDAG